MVGAGVAVGAGLTFALYRHIEGWLLLEPRRRDHVVFFPSGGLGLRLFVSLAAALVVALPELVWQAWHRLQCGATPSQRATQERLIALVALLPGAGVALGYYIVLPWYYRTFTALDSRHIRLLPRASTTVLSAITVLLLTVTAVELPVFFAGLRAGFGRLRRT
jgi:Sec-independent protein secretion pathway component TatC